MKRVYESYIESTSDFFGAGGDATAAGGAAAVDDTTGSDGAATYSHPPPLFTQNNVFLPKSNVRPEYGKSVISENIRSLFL